MSSPSAPPGHDPQPIPRTRVLAGGFLMGLANLVPGVSGGTMILALGLYDAFIRWVAELTTFRWSRALFVTLAIFASGLFTAVLALAGPAVHLVQHHTWIAYSLFIGMTLGGVPELLKMIRPWDLCVGLSVVAGLALMSYVAFGLSGGNVPQNALTIALIGAVAASSMILPGVSGSFILLIFGFYGTIIGSLTPSVLLDDPGGALTILGPFLVGVAVGIALLSNLLKVLLARFPRSSHGVLLGLLLGSVVPLYPFQAMRHAELLDRPTRKAIELMLEGQDAAAIEAELGLDLSEEKFATYQERYGDLDRDGLKVASTQKDRFRPAPGQVAGALALLLAGFVLTRLIGVRGEGEEPRASQ